MTSAIISLAQVADVAELEVFCTKQFTDTFAHTLSAEDLQLHVACAYSPDKLTQEVVNPNGLFIISRDPQGISGYAYILWHDAFTGPATVDLTNPRVAHLERFYVDQRAQGLGVAGALMAYTVDAARQKNSSGLWLTVFTENPRAQRFYRKHGFVDVGESVFVVGNDPQLDRLYFLSLD